MNGGGWIYGLSDPSDPWFGEDKVTHFGWAAAVFAHGFILAGVGRGFLEVAIGGVLVELVELLRYRRWVARLRPQPWPFLTDKISPKDLAWNFAGAAAMWFVLHGVMRCPAGDARSWR